MTPAARTSRRRAIRLWSAWYFVVPIATVGLFAFVPFVHAAVRLGRRRVWWFAAAYGAVTVLAFSAPDTGIGPLTAIAMLCSVTAAVVACAQLVPLRRSVYGLAEPAPPPGIDPAVAAVMRARQRRQKARELVGQDPLLARELHIGRPDIPHEYDDGGLVDLNAAPAEAIAFVCGIDVDQARQLVAVRDSVGGLNNVDELFVHTNLPPGAWERIRDRAIVLPR